MYTYIDMCSFIELFEVRVVSLIKPVMPIRSFYPRFIF